MNNTTMKVIEGGLLAIGGMILGLILKKLGLEMQGNWFATVGVGLGTIRGLVGLGSSLKKIKKNSKKIAGGSPKKEEEEYERAKDQWIMGMKSEFKKAQWGSVIQARKMQEMERWIEDAQEGSKAIIILSKRKGLDAIIGSKIPDFFMRMRLELYRAALDAQKVRAHDKYEISRNTANRLIQFNKRVDEYIEKLESMKGQYYDLERLILIQDGVETMELWTEAQKERVQEERNALIKLDREIKEEAEKMELISKSLKTEVEARIKKNFEKN